MLLRPLFVAAVATLVAAPLAAQEAAAPVAKPAKAKKVCRAVVPTGSIMPRSMCLTTAEWSEFQATNSRRVEMLTNEKSSSFDTRLPQ